ncbi:MAG: hypothetical protein HY720_14630 [Planctomycetes bacterium]|nr:hypothetical protein [Planctomycetota bacterium]
MPLVRARLDTLERLLDAPGEVFKKNSRRSVVRIEIAGPGAPRRIYVKAHPSPPAPRLVARLFGRASPTPARREWENLVHLERLGIRSMSPVALAEEPGDGPGRRSVLVTEEIEGVSRVEDFMPGKYPPGRLSRDLARSKRRLVERLAELARRFHGAGFFHKDFYLGHVLVREEPGPDFALWLIDLQRTERRERPCVRWFVKDLAQMLYTAPTPPVSAADKVRFLRLYRGVRRLGPAERGLTRRVLAKWRRMVRRFERKGPIRDWR